MNCDEVAEVRILVSEATILSRCMERGTFIALFFPSLSNCQTALEF